MQLHYLTILSALAATTFAAPLNQGTAEDLALDSEYCPPFVRAELSTPERGFPGCSEIYSAHFCGE